MMQPSTRGSIVKLPQAGLLVDQPVCKYPKGRDVSVGGSDPQKDCGPKQSVVSS